MKSEPEEPEEESTTPGPTSQAAAGDGDVVKTSSAVDGAAVEPSSVAAESAEGAPEGVPEATAGGSQTAAVVAEGQPPPADQSSAQPSTDGGEAVAGETQPSVDGAPAPTEGAVEGASAQVDGSAEGAAVPAEGSSAPAEGSSATAEGSAAPAEGTAEKKAPNVLKTVHSVRSVFRVRDQKEYDPFTAQLERRITKLFQALDTEGTGCVDVHELGTLVRSVGCCPSESDLQEMVTQLEEEGRPGLIRLETVMPHIIQCVEDRKYPSATVGQLLRAFQVLAEEKEDEVHRPGPQKPEKKEEEEGTLPQDKLVHILTEEGEHFSQEEVEEMVSVVPASDSGRVRYTEFVTQLVVPELW